VYCLLYVIVDLVTDVSRLNSGLHSVAHGLTNLEVTRLGQIERRLVNWR